MIILRTDLPIEGQPSVWASEIRVKALTPARRDKLVSLTDISEFILRTDEEDWQVGEIRDRGDLFIKEA